MWYDYKCSVCGNLLEDIQLPLEEAQTECYLECPTCKSQTIHKKILFPNPTRFKGLGWTTPTHGNKQ